MTDGPPELWPNGDLLREAVETRIGERVASDYESHSKSIT